MDALDTLRETFPPAAKDIQLNLSSVLQTGALSEQQRWGVPSAAQRERDLAAQQLHVGVIPLRCSIDSAADVEPFDHNGAVDFSGSVGVLTSIRVT